MPEAISPHPQGAVLAIKASPGSRKAGIRGFQAGALGVAVTQIAEKGKANQALVEYIVKALGLRRSQVELLSGETSRVKQLLVKGVTAEELLARIEAVLVENKTKSSPEEGSPNST